MLHPLVTRTRRWVGGDSGGARGKDVREAVMKGKKISGTRKNMKSQQMARSQNSGQKPKEVLNNSERQKDSMAKPQTESRLGTETSETSNEKWRKTERSQLLKIKSEKAGKTTKSKLFKIKAETHQRARNCEK